MLGYAAKSSAPNTARGMPCEQSRDCHRAGIVSTGGEAHGSITLNTALVLTTALAIKPVILLSGVLRNIYGGEVSV
jgi:hypothetical protein